MTTAALVALLVEYLPAIAADADAVVAVLGAALAAVTRAQDGQIAPEDWATLDAVVRGDLGALFGDAQSAP